MGLCHSFVKGLEFSLLLLSPNEFIHLIQEITDRIERERGSLHIFKRRSCSLNLCPVANHITSICCNMN